MPLPIPVRLGAAALTAFSVLASASAWAQTDADTRLPTDMADRVAACIVCHGSEGRATPDGYYPRIAGKPADYLYHQLLNFRDGRRQYAPMAWLLQNLPDAYLRDIASYFSMQHPPYARIPAGNASPAVLQRGEQLVRQGDPARRTPACVACHGEDLAGLAPAIPGLLGLPRDYLTAQLGAWQGGTRATPEPDCMTQVIAGVPPADIAAVAIWLSAQPVPPDYAPRQAPGAILPLACHGVPQAVAPEAP